MPLRPLLRLSAASLILAVALFVAPLGHAGTTNYYYDPVGRLLGETQTDGLNRTSQNDSADNPSYLHVFPTAPATAQATLQSGGIEVVGQGLTSNDGRFHLAIQSDGNLVVYQGSSTVLWAANTSGHQPGYLVMQTDGNLVFYGPDDSLIWQSQTSGYPNSHLYLGSDGNLIVYQNSTVTWSSNTGGH